MGDATYIEPNRKAQLVVLAIIILGVLLLISIDPLINYLMPSQSASLEEIKASNRIFFALNTCATLIGLTACLFWAYRFFRIGHRSRKIGSYPPPDAIVIFRTRMRTGKHALAAAWGATIYGIFMVLFACLLIYRQSLLYKLFVVANAL